MRLIHKLLTYLYCKKELCELKWPHTYRRIFKKSVCLWGSFFCSPTQSNSSKIHNYSARWIEYYRIPKKISPIQHCSDGEKLLQHFNRSKIPKPYNLKIILKFKLTEAKMFSLNIFLEYFFCLSKLRPSLEWLISFLFALHSFSVN